MWEAVIQDGKGIRKNNTQEKGKVDAEQQLGICAAYNYNLLPCKALSLGTTSGEQLSCSKQSYNPRHKRNYGDTQNYILARNYLKSYKMY